MQKATGFSVYLALATLWGGLVGFVGFGTAIFILAACGFLPSLSRLTLTLVATVCFALLGFGIGISMIMKRNKNCQQGAAPLPSAPAGPSEGARWRSV